MEELNKLLGCAQEDPPYLLHWDLSIFHWPHCPLEAHSGGVVALKKRRFRAGQAQELHRSPVSDHAGPYRGTAHRTAGRALSHQHAQVQKPTL